MKSFFFMLGSLLGSVALVTTACGSDSDNSSSSRSSASSSGTAPSNADAGPAVCTPDTVPADVRNASCAVTIQKRSLQEPASKHVQVGTSVEYCHNPPTSGPHNFQWTAFKEFTQPVEWPYLVHSEEHGAVLLLYNCGSDAGAEACPEIVEQLRQVRDLAPNDCGGAKRIIIAPVPTLPTKVAAAAWGISLTADCVDGPTLAEFVAANIGKSPEDICAPGLTFP